VARISARFILISGLSLKPSLGLSGTRGASFRPSIGVLGGFEVSGVSWSWGSSWYPLWLSGPYGLRLKVSF
jgi:hypothetical protein